jgi:hypothetical protein
LLARPRLQARARSTRNVGDEPAAEVHRGAPPLVHRVTPSWWAGIGMSPAAVA